MQRAVPECGWTCLTPADTTVRRWKPLIGKGFNPWFQRNGDSYSHRLEAKVADNATDLRQARVK